MAGGGAWRPPRSCEDYWWEWKHCRGLRHAFHHYYAHGELPACRPLAGRLRGLRALGEGPRRRRAGTARAPRLPPSRLGSERQPERRSLSRPVPCGLSEISSSVTLRKSPPPDWYIPLDQDKPN
ncbi:unnamed protein product [Bubo scandiacus]